jgi:hypothetical protein
MQKHIFTPEQEDQIRLAFDRLDSELAIQKLDDDEDLDRIFSRTHYIDPSQAWLGERLRDLEAKLNYLTNAIEVLLDPKSVFQINGQRSSTSTPSYTMENTEVSALSDNLGTKEEQLVKLNLELEKKQEESFRITESILRRFSDKFDEKLGSLTLLLEKQVKLLRASESIASEDRRGDSEDSAKPARPSSLGPGIQSHKPKRGRVGFSLMGDIFASPTYAFASVILIVSLGVAIGFQTSKLNVLEQVEDPLRGGKEIFQLVDNPHEAAQSFQKELISEGIPHQLDFESKDRIKIYLPVNEKTLVLAGSKRIELPQAEQCILVFEKAR